MDELVCYVGCIGSPTGWLLASESRREHFWDNFRSMVEAKINWHWEILDKHAIYHFCDAWLY